MLALDHLTKIFGNNIACDDVSLNIAAGEVLGLVGENGAGKTTLMNMAFGLYRPTKGCVRVNQKILPPGSTKAAIASGIGMVHQHFMLVPVLTVAENVVLGAEPRKSGGRFDYKHAQETVNELTARFGFSLDAKKLIADCSVGEQQRVEIIKLVYRGAKVLIFDEPTATLAPSEVEQLLALISALAKQGCAVLLVSHKLPEVLAVASGVAVMRRGRLVAKLASKDTNSKALSALMVGSEVSQIDGVNFHVSHSQTQPFVRLHDVKVKADRGHWAIQGLNLEIYAKEIVAVAGVDGNGQSELVDVLCGNKKINSGIIEFAKPLARTLLAHIPADRQHEGLCLSLTVEDNLIMGRHHQLANGILIDIKARRNLVQHLLYTHDIRPLDPTVITAVLSGGNQQKVIIARELMANKKTPLLVIAVQPTRGLDLGASARVHKQLREVRDAGAAVLLISMDLDEVRNVGDRIAVIKDGRIVKQLPAGANEKDIGEYMLAGETYV